MLYIDYYVGTAIKITLNLKDELYYKLKQLIPSRQVTKFISEAIQQNLFSKEEELTKLYREAYNDAERNSEMDEWDVLTSELDNHQEGA